jgi:patatin-like phospholipase/acyl hydrolase
MRVLSIDGGGIRGLIPALVLAEIERRTERRVADLFDLISGTSTGGILACALARPGPDGRPLYTAEELTELYVSEGPKIFNRSALKVITSVDGIIDERYENAGLRVALTRYLGGAMLSDALVPVLLTAYEIEDRFAFFFRSQRAVSEPGYDFTLVDAALATSSAPTYFEPVRVTDADGMRTYALVDGGVFASNPAMCAFVDLVSAGSGDEVELIASLGTGEQIRPIPYAQARNWGALEWARPIIDVLLSSATETVDFQLERLLRERYMRLQIRLEVAQDDMDDASPENLRDLQTEADRLLRKHAREIDELCAKLTA